MRPRLVWLVAVMVVAGATWAAQAPVPRAAGAATDKSERPQKFSARTARLAEAGRSGDQPEADQNREAGLRGSGRGSLLRDGTRRPVFYVRLTDTSEPNLQALRDREARILHVDPGQRQVTVAIQQRRLASLAEPDAVEFVIEAIAPATSGAAPLTRAQTSPCDATISEGDTQLQAAAARAAYGMAGAGVTVGVLSDSFDRAAGAATHAAGDVASDNLAGTGNPCNHPAPVGVLDDSTPSGGADEGRAMLQIVHDLAPAATLQFASAFTGLYQMADNIGALAQAGSDVIVDDITYFAEPFFQDGPISVAVSDAHAAGAVYLSSAGNENLVDAGQEFNGYEAPAYRATPCPAGIPSYEQNCHSFTPTGVADPTYRFTLAAGKSVDVDFQWAEPWSGVGTDLDAYLLEGATLRAESEDANVSSQFPFEFLSYENTSGAAKTLDLVLGRFSGGAPRLKFVFFAGNGTITGVEHAVPSAPDAVTGTIFGHNGTSRALTVAAARYDDNANPEAFSSRGPVTLYFGPVDGTTPAPALPGPQELAKPDVTATDGGVTTFFGGPAPPYRFFGTSAAAPHAAAVAALLKNRLPAITPASVGNVLRATARAMAGGTPASVGAGLVDALAAAGALSSPPPGYNGRIDGVRAVGAGDTYRLLLTLSDLYNSTRGCTLDPGNFSVCAATEP